MKYLLETVFIYPSGYILANKHLEKISLKYALQFIATPTRGEDKGAFSENPGGRRAKSSRPHHFNPRIIFALLWANFSPAASQQLYQLSAGSCTVWPAQNAKPWLDFLVFP